MSIAAMAKGYVKQMENHQLDLKIMELKHQQQKVTADVVAHERVRLRRLSTVDQSRGVGQNIDTLA